MTIKDSQQIVDDWIKKHGVRYFNELTNLAELARIIARKYGEQSAKNNEDSLEMADEMADILFVLICLANQTGVDLEQAMKKNLEKKTHRDAGRHLKNKKLQ